MTFLCQESINQSVSRSVIQSVSKYLTPAFTERSTWDLEKVVRGISSFSLRKLQFLVFVLLKVHSN